MILIPRIIFSVLGLLALMQEVVCARDSLNAVMARMRSATAVRIKYQETRHLELMTDPWHGSGYMYTMMPDIMVKEQLHPVREVMGAVGDEIYYYDPVKDVRYQATIEKDDPFGLQLAALQGLLHGDQQLLNEMYQMELISKRDQWILILKSESAAEGKSLSRLLVTGLPGAAANEIKVFQADGDHNDYTLEKDAEGKEIESIVKQLYKEMKGDE